MKIALEISIDQNGHSKYLITLSAENSGEQAILHLLAENKTALIDRDHSIHESYERTKEIYIRPEKDFSQA